MKIGFFVPGLLSLSGERKGISGLERFSWALIELMKDMGWEVEVNQNGNSDWQREINGVTIKGHGVARFSPEAVVEKINSCYDKVLYGTFLQKPMYYKRNSIVISHGVCWDDAAISREKRDMVIRTCRETLQQVDLMVSCDYNFLNVIRAVSPELTDKIRVIPNFVDTEKFKPVKRNYSDSIKLLYPGSLDHSQGIDIFIDVADRFISTKDHIEILVGTDHHHPEYSHPIKAFLDLDQVTEFHLQLEEMPKIYQQADITVLPSRSGEGTSFSCLEAMASGNAIVATDVGGLTNLILNGYNGLLVPPRAKPIEKAIDFLINNPSARHKLGKNARNTALAFTLERWRKQWAEYLVNIYSAGDHNGF